MAVGSADLYREMARSLLQKAALAETEAARMAFLAMADGWYQMAQPDDWTMVHKPLPEIFISH